MITEQGIITKVSGNRAWVEVQRTEACENCGSKGACGALGGHGGKNMECESLNSAGGAVGDRVLLQIGSGSLLKIAFIFYMLPVVGLIAGAVAGSRLGPGYGVDQDLGSIIGATAFFLVSFGVVQVMGRWLKQGKNNMPEIVKVMPKVSGDDIQLNLTEKGV